MVIRPEFFSAPTLAALSPERVRKPKIPKGIYFVNSNMNHYILYCE
jgi:hypothetical protein